MTISDDFPETIGSWGELSELIEHFSFFNAYDWLFRGVTDAKYGLQPKIGRTSTRAKKRNPHGKRERVPYRKGDEAAVISMFKQQARPFLSYLPTSELEWLAIAEHHGLPTRLLDWTDTLLVAACFAVAEGGAGERDSAIWITRDVSAVDVEKCTHPLNLTKPKCYRPPHITPRISAQGSVFVICPEPDEELDLAFLKKVIIKHSAQFTIKKRLSACGINRRHLFPDLGGLSEHLGWLYKNDWLAGYKQGVNDDEPDEK